MSIGKGNEYSTLKAVLGFLIVTFYNYNVLFILLLFLETL
jgi:hypothetical protein